MGKTVGELHAMLNEYKKGLLKKAETPQVIMIKSGKIQKANKKSLNAKGKNKVNGKGKDKKVYIPKPNNPKPTAKERPAKDDACHHCKEVGHWKRNCHVYLAELQKKRKQVGSASSSGIFTIELFSFPNNNSWVYDTGCGTNICITKQGFRIERKLKQGALYLYVGNGVRAQVEAIGSFDLVLPNGLVICLDNCHYAPTITRGVVSVSRLVDNGFVQCFTDCGISVSKNGVLYFNAVPRNGIYEIDMHDLVPNVNSIYNMTKKPFPHSNERAKDLLGIIHTDVCGPLRHVSRQGASYFITFTDDYSRYGYVYLLKHKHEICGGEYISQEFKEYLKANRIVQQLTPPYTPQHNGVQSRLFDQIELTPPYTPQQNEVSERRNRTLLDMVRSMMNLTTLPLSFWDSALESATRILNMVPIKKVDKTPYELCYGKVPNLSYLKVWGYTSPSEITSKIPMEVEGFKPPQEEVIPIRRSKRTHRAQERLCLNVEVEEHSLGDLNEPTSYKAAMLDSESNKWIDAMNAEIQSMIDNMVWVLVNLPPGCKTVGSKWIFKKKTDMDGIVHTYKARLVAKGYTQLYEVDYEETFSPVADIRAIRILISIAAKVCKLQRSIYGLKQASRSWNKRFDEEIKRFRFTQNLDEPCVYQKASGSNVTFLILYVDDIIIMENHILSLQSVKDYLEKCFAMKDLEEAAFILGIKIYRDRSK
ncbi:retrotransposon protein, putative, ty1-copia subclass [Tanacetum coccineum]